MADVNIEEENMTDLFDEEMEFDSMFDEEINRINEEIRLEEEQLFEDGEEENDVLDHIPSLIFFSDDNVQVIVDVDIHKKGKSQKRLVLQANKQFCCEKCGKGYQIKRFFDKHVQECQGCIVKDPNIDWYFESKKDEYLTSLWDFFDAALKDACEDPFFNLVEPGSLVGKNGKQLHEKINNASLVPFLNYVSEKFYQIMLKKKVTVSEHEHLMREFQEMSNDPELKILWNQLLQKFSLDYTYGSPLLHFILNSMLKQSLRFCRKNEVINSAEVDNIKLTPEEEQTLMYVAGYIIYCIKKSVRKKTTSEGEAVLGLLSKWCSDNSYSDGNINTLDEYTRLWVNQVNRGGLFIVNNKFLNFIKHIETHVRLTLNLNLFATYAGENLKALLIQKLNGNRPIAVEWASLTENVANDNISNELRQICFQKWVDLRTKAFVNGWIQMMKLKTAKKGETVTEKGEPSLRKSLFGAKSKASQMTAQNKIKQAKKKVKKAKVLLSKKI